MNKENIGIGTTAPQAFIHITMTKEDFKNYPLRVRIGIHILRLIGVVKLEIIADKNNLI